MERKDLTKKALKLLKLVIEEHLCNGLDETLADTSCSQDVDKWNKAKYAVLCTWGSGFNLTPALDDLSEFVSLAQEKYNSREDESFDISIYDAEGSEYDIVIKEIQLRKMY